MQSTIGGAKRVRKETNEVDAALNALLDAKWLKRKRDAAAIPVAPDQLPPAAVLALLTSLESSLEKSSAVASACERVFESFCDERQHLPGTLVRLLRLMGISQRPVSGGPGRRLPPYGGHFSQVCPLQSFVAPRCHWCDPYQRD